MLEKGRIAINTLCVNIIILFILCIGVILINFFTEDNIAKETVVGINPINLTKSTMKYEEPLVIVIDKKEKEENPKIQTEIINNDMEIKIEDIYLENETIAEKDDETEIEENLEKRESQEENVSMQNEIINEEQEIEEKNEKEIQAEETMQVEEDQNEEQKEIKSIQIEFNGFETVGNIQIPKTGLDIPILSHVTVEGMKNAPCLLYSTGELNKNGNNLIVGHNFRNGTIFSDNKKLELEDKIYVTALDGNRVEYTIYSKFITTAEDTSYIKRDTDNKPEITLSCCTDDDELRIIILAKMK